MQSHPVALVALLLSTLLVQDRPCCDGKKNPKPWKGYGNGLQWEDDLDAAKKKARQEARPVLLLSLVGDMRREGIAASAHVLRTLTFPDITIQEYVGDHFYCVWENRSEKFHDCGFARERRIATHFGEQYSSSEVVTFILHPDGGVIHYFAGYLNSTHYLNELRFAKALHGRVADFRGKLKKDGWDGYRKLHEKRMEERKAAARDLRRLKLKVPRYFGIRLQKDANRFPKTDDDFMEPGAWIKGEIDGFAKMNESQLKSIVRSRQDHLADGYMVLYQVSKQLAANGARLKRMPTLKEIAKSIRSGGLKAEE